MHLFYLRPEQLHPIELHPKMGSVMLRPCFFPVRGRAFQEKINSFQFLGPGPYSPRYRCGATKASSWKTENFGPWPRARGEEVDRAGFLLSVFLAELGRSTSSGNPIQSISLLGKFVIRASRSQVAGRGGARRLERVGLRKAQPTTRRHKA